MAGPWWTTTRKRGSAALQAHCRPMQGFLDAAILMKPFAGDRFTGMLSFPLLDMGLRAAHRVLG
jgi:hypothetical protein